MNTINTETTRREAIMKIAAASAAVAVTATNVAGETGSTVDHDWTKAKGLFAISVEDVDLSTDAAVQKCVDERIKPFLFSQISAAKTAPTKGECTVSAGSDGKVTVSCGFRW